MNDHPTVLYTAENAIATITLNRPWVLNAMNDALMVGISDAMRQIEDDKSIRVVVLTGTGRAFCAGADLGASAERQPIGPTDTMQDRFNPAMRAVHECPVPTIARVNGAAAGGGLGLALACDIAIAAESAFFVATFGPKLGIVPDLGTTWNLPRKIGRSRALGMSLLGDRISAEQAKDWGLIWDVVADERLDDEVSRVADSLSRTSPEAMTRTRESIDAALDNTFSEQLDLEMKHQSVLIPRNMSEGAKAFMEKREPHFKGR
ncbi:MAG: enoyl-CoA hydratase-related protein [Pseudomonadales bacterium]